MIYFLLLQHPQNLAQCWVQSSRRCCRMANSVEAKIPPRPLMSLDEDISLRNKGLEKLHFL